MTTETLEEIANDLVLLNSVFLENPMFFQVLSRASVVEELLEPVRAACELCGSWVRSSSTV